MKNDLSLKARFQIAWDKTFCGPFGYELGEAIVVMAKIIIIVIFCAVIVVPLILAFSMSALFLLLWLLFPLALAFTKWAFEELDNL